MNPANTAPQTGIPTVYYTDELKDDFAGVSRKPFEIDGSYPYRRRNFLWRIAEFLVYRVIMTPFAFLYSKLKYRYKIVNRR